MVFEYEIEYCVAVQLPFIQSKVFNALTMNLFFYIMRIAKIGYNVFYFSRNLLCLTSDL